MRQAVYPSGNQIELQHGGQRVVVVEVGGGLRTYSIAGTDVLDGYGADELCTAGRGQLLIPWPNRIADGRYAFGGQSFQLPLTEPEACNAIHGLVRWSPWTLAGRTGNRVALEHVVRPQPGYPFPLGLSVEYELSDGGLRVRTTATNLGAEPCPYAFGVHPYLTLGTTTVDPLELTVHAATVLRSDTRGIPTTSEGVDGTDLDFRSPRAIGSTKLDNCYTDLARDGDGLARVELREPRTGAGLTLWFDESHPYVVVFTGDHPEVNRGGVAVEPMTSPPNAFGSDTDVIRLEPGRSTTGVWGIRPIP
jgi:aldose 1-epimerase